MTKVGSMKRKRDGVKREKKSVKRKKERCKRGERGVQAWEKRGAWVWQGCHTLLR